VRIAAEQSGNGSQQVWPAFNSNRDVGFTHEVQPVWDQNPSTYLL
jgi:hypothetical protein